jgi:hypothetical protein
MWASGEAYNTSSSRNVSGTGPKLWFSSPGLNVFLSDTFISSDASLCYWHEFNKGSFKNFRAWNSRHFECTICRLQNTGYRKLVFSSFLQKQPCLSDFVWSAVLKRKLFIVLVSLVWSIFTAKFVRLQTKGFKLLAWFKLARSETNEFWISTKSDSLRCEC